MKRMSMILTAVLVIVLSAIVVYMFSGKVVDRFEEAAAPRATLKLFHATWCPHCVNYLKPKDGSEPVWTVRLPAALKKANMTDVKLESIDYDKNKELANKYHVNGFPSIVGENAKGEVKKFEGNRDSVEELIQFAKALRA